MKHLDPEVAALAALGEPIVDVDMAHHVASCESCQHEVEAFQMTVMVARSAIGEHELLTPPARVWQRLHAELGLGADVHLAPNAAVAVMVSASGEALAEPAAVSGPAPAPTHVVVTRDAPVTRLDARRERRGSARRLAVAITASAAAAAIITGGALWWATGEPGGATQVIASAQLAALPDWSGSSGQASVAEGANGERVVTVSLDAIADDDVVREVWLLTENVDGLISLGWLTGAEGEFVVPASVDLTKFSVVDISAEPLDGDPTHSGDSIVRGSLDT
jgi:hypothetical protein